MTRVLDHYAAEQVLLNLQMAMLKDQMYVNEVAYITIIKKYCTKYKVDPKLVMAVIKVESDYDPKALSNKGAIGLMQIMPDTYSWVCKNFKLSEKDLRNPNTNIQAGVLYLGVLMEKHGDIRKVLAEYNGGPRASRSYPHASKDVVVYVDRVMGYYKDYRKHR
jgi:soluble lytic murein transglycosylase